MKSNMPFVIGATPKYAPIVTNDTEPVINTAATQYPNSDEFEYRVSLERINLDEECERDMKYNDGFFIKSAQTIKKEVKNEDGIFSSKFGQGLQDPSPYQDRYRCQCGKHRGKIEHNILCPECHTPVIYRDDNLNLFAYIQLDEPYYIIHPSLFNSVKNLIGADRLDKILKYDKPLDQDGHIVVQENQSYEDSLKGIGLLEFRERFDEIIAYFASKNKAKDIFYKDLLENRDKVFMRSIPVYSLILRPYKIQDGHFFFEGSNADYNLIAKYQSILNNKAIVTDVKETKSKVAAKSAAELLYDIQMKYNHLVSELNLVLSGKRGSIRGLFGGRFNFTSRCVIIPDSSLKIDEIKLPYVCLMAMLQPVIINVIKKTFNKTYMEAYLMWYEGSLKYNDTMAEIINTIIKNNPTGRGVPMFINRNPTIRYGSFMQMYCVGINKHYAMSVPLQILVPLNADFDGDVLNITWIISEELLMYAENVYNPRNAMMINRNNGQVDIEVMHNRDTMLVADCIKEAGTNGYTEEELLMNAAVAKYAEQMRLMDIQNS